MPDPKRVTIRHPKDGREYSIESSDFTNPGVHPEKVSYAAQGFEIVAHVDGTAYDGPKSQREIDKIVEARQAAREERAAAKADKDGGKGRG